MQEAGTRGTCHTACTPGAASSPCASGEMCIYADPCQDTGTGTGFCITPQPVDAGCAPADDHFCGPDADCVNFATSGQQAVLICKPDCSSASDCSVGVCNSLPQSCRSACY